MAYNSQEYRAAIGKWAKKVDAEGLKKVARVSIQNMCEGVIDATHVDTGFLVGSWQPSLTAPELSTGDLDPEKVEGSIKIALILTDIEIGDIFYYTNVVEYAKYQEEGTSKMAGVHMVGQNVANWQHHVDEALDSLGLK